MKELINFCRQTSPYADSKGLCLVELEDDETVDDVINKYIMVEREWFEEWYSNPRELKEYTHHGKTFKGRLVLMNVRRVFLD